MAKSSALKDTALWFEIEEAVFTGCIGDGNPDEAAAIYESAFSILESQEKGDPLHTWFTLRILTSLGDLYLRKGARNKSIAAYENALTRIKEELGEAAIYKPNCIKIHKALAALYREKAEDEKARLHEKKASDLEFNDPR